MVGAGVGDVGANVYAVDGRASGDGQVAGQSAAATGQQVLRMVIVGQPGQVAVVSRAARAAAGRDNRRATARRAGHPPLPLHKLADGAGELRRRRPAQAAHVANRERRARPTLY